MMDVDKQFPTVEKTLNEIDRLINVYVYHSDRMSELSLEEKIMVSNPMVHLAESFYYDNPNWAVDLAELILAIHKTASKQAVMHDGLL